MEFNSLAYALFFAVVTAIYYSAPMSGARRQNLLVLACSYLFYGAWDWRFLSLIILTTLSTYLAGRMIAKSRAPRMWMVGNIVLNLGILAVFKYFNFFSENVARLMLWFGWEMDWFTLDVLLPVGISFYTFQAIGYTVDVWRGKVQPSRNLILFATFIAYFPQLVAGPIERASDLLPQLDRVNRWNWQRAVDGMRLILWGMLKKVAIADPCGALVDSYYPGQFDGVGGARLYVAAMFFLIQIYCDFSGYCDIAAGSSSVLGIKLTMNFNRPLISRNFVELWRRWHISLTKWFTDYVYIPMGGSRCGSVRHYVNIMMVFLLSGLWHGAGWGFIIWGMVCGMVLCLQKILRLPDFRNGPQAVMSDIPAILATASVYAVAFVPFRLNGNIGMTLELCFRYIIPVAMIVWVIVKIVWSAMEWVFCRDGACSILRHLQWRRIYFCGISLFFLAVAAVEPERAWFNMYLLVAAICFGCEWMTRGAPWGSCPFPLPASRFWRIGVYMLFYLLILTYGLFRLPPVVDGTTFIYFQF